jgi:hypothetical protein
MAERITNRSFREPFLLDEEKAAAASQVLSATI